MNRFKRHVAFIAWLLLGIMFIVSASTKSMDLFAFSSKIKEYLIIFGLEFSDSLYELSALFIIGLEFIIGLLILNGITKPLVYRFAMVILLFFSGVTLIVAVDGTMDSCGCFGNVMNLPPWQSFVKNVVLLIILILAYPQLKCGNHNNPRRVIYSIILIGMFCISLLFSQPMLDSNIYAKGNIITVNDNDMSSLDIEFINGKQPSYSQYIFGIIKDFRNVEKDVIVSFIKRLSDIYKDKHLIIITSVPANVIEPYLFPDTPIGLVDGTSLSNMISSNIGVIEVKNGTITSKWQQDYLEIQHLISDDIKQDGLKTITCIIMILIVVISVCSLINTIKRECRKTHNKCRLI